MEYLCLIYGEALGEAESDSPGGPPPRGVRYVDRGVDVRVRKGRIGVTEGAQLRAVAELTGFLILEARDLNDAIRIAAKESGARAETIGVHPLQAGPAARPEALSVLRTRAEGGEALQ